MNRWLGFSSIVFSGTFCGLLGCSLQYNGAFGPSDTRAQEFARRRSIPQYPAAQPTPTVQSRPRNRPRPLTRTQQRTNQRQATTDNLVKFAPANQRHRTTQAPKAAWKPAVKQSTVERSAVKDVSKPRTPLVRSAAKNPAGGGARPIGLYGQLASTPGVRTAHMDSADNIRRVTFASEGADFDPQIDPAGKLLVYASTQHRETSDLYIKRIDGNTITQLTSDPANDIMPDASPDGSRIAFASDRAGNWDIYMVGVNGGQPVQLTNGPSDDLHPSFSPDGKQLVYCSYSEQAGQWELVVIDTDNPAAKRFIGFGLFPEWAPNDNRIVFQRARERGTRWFSIWKVDLVNGEGVRPTEIAASTNAACITPTWSPAGRHIAFTTIVNPDTQDNVNPQQADIWIVRDDGGARANLTSGSDVNLQPAWAADGAIYFVSDRAGSTMENIWSVRPDRALKVVGSQGPADQRTTQAPTP